MTSATVRITAIISLVSICAGANAASPTSTGLADVPNKPGYFRRASRVLSPRDGQWFDAGRHEFNGEGTSNFAIEPQLFDREAGEWFDASAQVSAFVWESFDAFGAAPAGPARRDARGVGWYRWHGDADWSYFDAALAGPLVVDPTGQRGAPIELRFVNAINREPFSHFATNPEECVAEHEADGVTAVMNTCALEKDSVTYIFKCGRADQACCAGAELECDDGSSCRDHRCHAPSDGAGPRPIAPTPSSSAAHSGEDSGRGAARG
jgi:hypothetical protein